MGGFVYLLIYRVNALKGLAVAGGIAVSGTAIYLWRARRDGHWPFSSAASGR
jgi:hypothetical protein